MNKFANIKNKFKAAFTLAEITIVFVVISVVVAATLIVQKPFDKALSFVYYSAYQALFDSGYNLYIDTGGAFPNTPKALCERLVGPSTTTYSGYINTAGTDNCDATPVSVSTTNFVEANRFFTAANGIIFYISTLNNLSAQDDFGNAVRGSYFVIFVDLNGKSKPNTILYSDQKSADIVPFVMTTSGDIIPVGEAVINRKYLSARVAYPSIAGQDPTYSTAMSLYEARCNAWGNKAYLGNPMSYNFSDIFPYTVPQNTSCQVDTVHKCIEGNSECKAQVYKKVDL